MLDGICELTLHVLIYLGGGGGYDQGRSGGGGKSRLPLCALVLS